MFLFVVPDKNRKSIAFIFRSSLLLMALFGFQILVNDFVLCVFKVSESGSLCVVMSPYEMAFTIKTKIKIC